MSEIDWKGFYAARADRMLGELEALVRMESPSRDADAIRDVAAWLAAELARVGATAELVEDHPNGPNLVARYGEGDRPVLLVGHTDTVWDRGTLARMPWRVEAGLAYGPGVFDMKAGCLVAVEAVRGLAAHGLRPPIAVVLNCDEEIGSGSSRAIIERHALSSRAALVLEPAIPGGLAKTSRSGMADYRVRVTGRAAHAGVDPEKGVSAIAVAADLVTRLHALNDLAAGLSVNVGCLRGGTRHNVVAAEAVLDVDVRFRTEAQAERVDAAIRAMRPALEGATLEVAGGVDRPPFEPTPAGEALYERAARAARAAGFEMGRGHVGGVSDGNFTAALGVPTLDGLGVDGMGAHADHEQIVVDDLARRPAMLARLVVDLAGAGG
jgi:glutamate carboxypeptidase